MSGRPLHPESQKLLKQIVLAATASTLLLLAFLFLPHRTSTAVPAGTVTPSVAAPPAFRPVTPITQAQRKFINSFMQELIAQQNAYVKKSNACTKRLSGLLEAPSFANADAMRKMQANLAQCTQLDFALYREITQRVDALPARVQPMPWSAAEKDQVVQSFHVATQTMVQQLDEQYKMEQAWYEATNDVYTFALRHAQVIHIMDGKLLVLNDPVRKGLDTRLERAVRLTRQFDDTHGNQPRPVQ